MYQSLLLLPLLPVFANIPLPFSPRKADPVWADSLWQTTWSSCKTMFQVMFFTLPPTPIPHSIPSEVLLHFHHVLTGLLPTFLRYLRELWIWNNYFEATALQQFIARVVLKAKISNSLKKPNPSPQYWAWKPLKMTGVQRNLFFCCT